MGLRHTTGEVWDGRKECRREEERNPSAIASLNGDFGLGMAHALTERQSTRRAGPMALHTRPRSTCFAGEKQETCWRIRW